MGRESTAPHRGFDKELWRAVLLRELEDDLRCLRKRVSWQARSSGLHTCLPELSARDRFVVCSVNMI